MPAVEHVAMVADNRVNVWTKRVMRQPPGVREISRLLYASKQSVQFRGPIPTSYKRTVSGLVPGLPGDTHLQISHYGSEDRGGRQLKEEKGKVDELSMSLSTCHTLRTQKENSHGGHPKRFLSHENGT